MKVFFIVLSCLFISAAAYAQETNYCLDKQSWAEWDELAIKYPNDKDVQTLHAIRIGLCRKIKDETISFEVARDAFSHMHQVVIDRAKEQQKKILENQQL